MDERRLRAFLAIADERTLTEAAARLRVAQPSLSQTLRSLERELGAELFHRLGRGLELTDAGRALIGPARQALLALDDARGAVREVSELREGSVRVAALATLAADPLAALTGALRRAHPQLTVQIAVAESSAGAARMVAEGAAELGVVHLPVAREDLVVEALGSQRLLFALPPAQAPSDAPLSAAELRAVPLVVTPPGTSIRELLEHAFARAGIAPRIAVETAAREAIVPLVLAGAGAALLPESLAQEAARRGARLRAARPPLRRRIGLVRRAGPVSPAARAFVGLAVRRGA